MNVERYLAVLGLPEPKEGGQELILGEVVASLYPAQSVWVPFEEQCQTLIQTLRRLDVAVVGTAETWAVAPSGLEAVYFGTPTIVDGRSLFPNRRWWSKEMERQAVRTITRNARARGYTLLVCGLGSGDIALDERLEDIDGGEVVATKQFDGFTDWVIRKELR